jgi:hypothetical protein
LGKSDENDSCWVRVAQGWAGKQWGALFLPRIGQEVVVSFLDGNPDRPLVTGSVYNADQTVPYALPDDQTKSTIKSNTSKGGAGFNEFRFEDKEKRHRSAKRQDFQRLLDTGEGVHTGCAVLHEHGSFLILISDSTTQFHAGVTGVCPGELLKIHDSWKGRRDIGFLRARHARLAPLAQREGLFVERGYDDGQASHLELGTQASTPGARDTPPRMSS